MWSFRGKIRSFGAKLWKVRRKLVRVRGIKGTVREK